MIRDPAPSTATRAERPKGRSAPLTGRGVSGAPREHGRGSRRKPAAICALDMGSTKILCMVAEAGEDGALALRAVGHHAARGIRSGVIIDLEAAELSVLNALHEAEQAAGMPIRQVTVSVGGGQPASRMLTVDVPLGGHEVSDGDVRRVLAAGARIDETGAVEQGRELLHSIPIAYAIDDTRGIRDPRGMFGERLGVTLHVVTASTGTLRNIAACLDRCHLDIELVGFTPIAAGLGALVPDEMELGVTVIDLGGGTTSFAVFFEGEAVYAEVLPVGGNHVTADLARGLATPLGEAERLKTLYGSAIAAPADERALVAIPALGDRVAEEDARIPRAQLVQIIRPRLEEILELVRSRLQASGFAGVAGRRVVLTGGGSQLPGLVDLATAILGRQVRQGRVHAGLSAPQGGSTPAFALSMAGGPPAIRLAGFGTEESGPEMAVCAGLLRFAARHRLGVDPAASLSRQGTAGMFGRLGLWLKEHF